MLHVSFLFIHLYFFLSPISRSLAGSSAMMGPHLSACLRNDKLGEPCFYLMGQNQATVCKGRSVSILPVTQSHVINPASAHACCCLTRSHLTRWIHQPLASDRMLSGFVLRCLCDGQCVDVWALQCSHVTDSTDGWMVQELAWLTQKKIVLQNIIQIKKVSLVITHRTSFVRFTYKQVMKLVWFLYSRLEVKR